ncbi:MAG: RDD family protein [Campylobacterales bacterium]|nr:RDD family protein [Campylobacterales bacterium]
MAKQRFRDVKKGNVQAVEPKPQKKQNAPTIPYASIGDRIKAFITDLFMLLMPIVYIVFYAVMGSREAFAQHMAMGWIYIIIPNFIIVLLFLRLKGQTPGAKAYHIKLVDRQGNIPSTLAIALRYYVEILGFMTVIGIFIPFFRKDKRSLHDILSATHFITLEK